MSMRNDRFMDLLKRLVPLILALALGWGLHRIFVGAPKHDLLFTEAHWRSQLISLHADQWIDESSKLSLEISSVLKHLQSDGSTPTKVPQGTIELQLKRRLSNLPQFNEFNLIFIDKTIIRETTEQNLAKLNVPSSLTTATVTRPTVELWPDEARQFNLVVIAPVEVSPQNAHPVLVARVSRPSVDNLLAPSPNKYQSFFIDAAGHLLPDDGWPAELLSVGSNNAEGVIANKYWTAAYAPLRNARIVLVTIAR